ncbi:MAG: hypothetical protein D6723_13360 [Acidobacteria bacterium]|nr:MAG: hypothetical protein D6723_13360 [Acidobacteriota bacterium]
MRRSASILTLTVSVLLVLVSSVATAPGYLDYPAIVARLRSIARTHPDIARAVKLNDLLHTPLTHEGRALWALKISDHAVETEDEPAFLVDGCHHARELVTPLAVLDIAETLTSAYGRDPHVTRWVNAYEIWLIPCVNPDGLAYVFSRDSYWRKNRRPNGDGTFGVDLNRNYPFMWGVCGANSARTASDVYRGPAPASEAEIQTMLALGARERPVIYISYHSFGEEVLYPYLCGSLAERELYHTLRDQYAEAMRYSIRLASSSGESFEHFYNRFGSIAFLTEIGRSFQPPPDRVPHLVAQLRSGWRFLLDRGLGPSVYGHIRDAMTGEPVTEASISIAGIAFTEGEVRRPEPLFGRYQWLLLPGTYTITFSAPGYESITHTVEIKEEAVRLDVDLIPLVIGARRASKELSSSR